MDNYVLNHDFGYDSEKYEINKLSLRNIIDVNAFVNQILQIMLVAKVDNLVVKFTPENIQTKVIIKKVS